MSAFDPDTIRVIEGITTVLTTENIESELSYAYLHAVAAWAGFACEYAGRHSDGGGVDATVKWDGSLLGSDSKLTYVVCDVQPKATFQEWPESGNSFSFPLLVPQYDKLRSTRLMNPRILVVLRLPPEQKDWLQVSAEALIAKRCAYWVSLRGAEEVVGQKEKTVYVPTTNLLTPKSLKDIVTTVSRQEVIPYAGK